MLLHLVPAPRLRPHRTQLQQFSGLHCPNPVIVAVVPLQPPSHSLMLRALAALPPGSQLPSGAKRILRLLPRLQPVACLGHARLLQLLAQRQPMVAAEYLTSLSMSLEPAVRKGCGG